jgi:hypothetical protein
MAKQTRSAVFAIKAETTEGTYVAPGAATDFTVLRQGFNFESNVETTVSDELVNDIGASEGLVTRESPKASIPKYFKHSGTEGSAPDYSLLIKSAMGSQATAGTEYDTVSSSTAGTSSAAATLIVDTGEGASFSVGQAVLVKDGTNGYAIRNVKSISSDTLTLNYNLAGAPASGVNTGKCTHFTPAATGHPTFTAHLYQAGSSSAFHQAISGCRTTGMSIEFPANDLATIAFDIEGLSFYMNPMTVTASNKYIDFNIDGAGTDFSAILTAKTYKTPADVAREVASKMTAACGSTISCSYSSSTGKFTISKASGTLQILWLTGTNTANTAATLLGFTVADNTLAITYTSNTAQTYSPAYTPTFDDNGPNVVRYNELLIGNFARNDLRKASKVSLSISTPKTDVKDVTSETGVSESVVLSREVTMSATLIFQDHEITELDALLQNSTTSLMFNHGPKSNGNWVAGKCVNVYMPNAKITGNKISDSDGLVVVEIEAKGFVSTSQKDIHLNFV